VYLGTRYPKKALRPLKNGPLAKQFGGKTQKATWRRPIKQMSVEQPNEARLPTNMLVEQPSDARLSTNLITEQPSETGSPTNPMRQGHRATQQGYRPTSPPSNPARRHPGRVDLVLPNYVDTTGHHWTVPGPWKWHRGVSVKHDDGYVYLLTCGTERPRPYKPQHRGTVSTVTHTPERTWQYTVPAVHLPMMKNDTRGW
jgi:hypothetical protein